MRANLTTESNPNFSNGQSWVHGSVHLSGDFIQVGGIFPLRKDEQSRGNRPFLHMKTTLLSKLFCSQRTK